MSTAGQLTVGGTLDVTVFGTAPAVGSSFRALTWAHRTGRFARVANHGGRSWRLTYRPRSLLLTARS